MQMVALQNQKSMKEDKKITYTFADGLLGWKVVKDYEFEY
jgi:hypothetical protein